jgi:sulfofructosephosphate aldolase
MEAPLTLELPEITPQKVQLYQKITRPSGGFAMVAIDQRESLRNMFGKHLPGSVEDDILVEFKAAVAELLSIHASAMLFDRLYGWPALKTAKTTGNCGLILAADELVQSPGENVVDSGLDEQVDLEDARLQGVSALKLLLIWKGEQNAQYCIDTAKKFMGICRDANLLGIVEAIVRPPDGSSRKVWDREAALVDAAVAFANVKPDLYKTEVPLLGNGNEVEIRSQAQKISDVIPCPWVVLSSGVKPERFPASVKAACRGGASGFLAGRGIWGDAVRQTPGEYRQRLKDISTARLQELVNIVDEHAQPWQQIYKLGTQYL